jgi:hypothetical protein
MHLINRYLVANLFALICAIPDATAATIPGPADFGYLFKITDSYEDTTPVDTGVVGTTSPFVNLQQNYVAPGGIATIDLSSTATATAGGLPLTQVEVLGTSISVGNATGQASAALSYQIVISGPGNPGDLVEIDFAALGSLTNISPCTICLPSTLSSSAMLSVSQGGSDYFLLGDFLESTGSSTLFQSGAGTKSIDIMTRLMLPIETQINVSMGVSAFGETQGMFGNPGLQAPDDISLVAMLDPSFTPLDSNYTVLISSNLQPVVVPLPTSVWLFISALGLLGSFIRPRRVNFPGN